MAENISFNNIFQYLEKELIPFDKEEFLFQIQSHPDYPTLLSISDTLTFFNIDNGAIPFEASQIDLLPDQFMGILREANNEPQLYYIQKKDGNYITIKDKTPHEIDQETLESRWMNLIFLVEKPDFENTTVIKKDKKTMILSLLCIVLFLLFYFTSATTITKLLFVLFPITGILFSIAALKDLFGTDSKFINKFCTITTTTNCTAVVSSSKWKIFDIISFSDLSIIFFFSQFLGLITLLISGNFLDFFTIQKGLLLISVPFLGLSVYYQKFVEKKWCPICLVIASIILLEITYLYLFSKVDFTISNTSLLLYAYIILITITLWVILKKMLSKQKKLKEFQIKSNRLLRNYSVFKNTLITTPKIDIPSNVGLLFGNRKSASKITIITNPFCAHCKEVHKIINKILHKHGDQIQVQILFKTALELDNEQIKHFFRILMTIYLEKGETPFKHALSDFFESKDIERWTKAYQIDTNNETVDTIYATMNQWCLDNQINYTPEICINGYKYPSGYEKEYLPFFINDLIEDVNF